MATATSTHDGRLAFIFGLLGNFISCFLHLAPMNAFFEIWQGRRSIESMEGVSYSVCVFNSMLMIYYAYLKNDLFLLVTINSVASGLHIVYIFLFFTFSNPISRLQTAQMFTVFNTAVFLLVVMATSMIKQYPRRVIIVGWIIVISCVSTYSIPISRMRQVIKTKSVHHMSFPFCVFFTLGAIAWFLYGIFIHDNFVAWPNIVGVAVGIAQMVLYMLYRKDRNTNGNENERERQSSEMTNVGTSSRRTDLTDIAEIVEEEDETQIEALELGSTVTAEPGPTLTDPTHIYIIHNPSSASPPSPHMLSVSV